MKLDLPAIPHTPQELPTPSVPRKSYAHLPFSADPKKALIRVSLKRLKLLPISDLVDELLSAFRFGSNEERVAASAQYEQNEVEILQALETETHIALIESIELRFQSFALQHCSELIEEYACTMPSEKMLCEMAAGAAVQFHSSGRRLKDLRDENWSHTNRRTKKGGSQFQPKEEEWTTARDHLQRISAESKEIDRSARRYQSIVAHLKQMRSPVPDVHIGTAFVAQNQQINAGTP